MVKRGGLPRPAVPEQAGNQLQYLQNAPGCTTKKIRIARVAICLHKILCYEEFYAPFPKDEIISMKIKLYFVLVPHSLGLSDHL